MIKPALSSKLCPSIIAMNLGHIQAESNSFFCKKTLLLDKSKGIENYFVKIENRPIDTNRNKHFQWLINTSNPR